MPLASRPWMPGYGIVAADEGEGLFPFEWAEERFARNRNYWLSTVRPGGAPHAMAVWGAWVDGAFWFNTARDSRKARNLAGDPRCTVTTEDGDECVVLEGEAAIVEGRERLAPFFDAYHAKYDFDITQWPHPNFRVRPTKMFAFCEAADRFGNTATRWTFASEEEGEGEG